MGLPSGHRVVCPVPVTFNPPYPLPSALWAQPSPHITMIRKQTLHSLGFSDLSEHISISDLMSLVSSYCLLRYNKNDGGIVVRFFLSWSWQSMWVIKKGEEDDWWGMNLSVVGSFLDVVSGWMFCLKMEQHWVLLCRSKMLHAQPQMPDRHCMLTTHVVCHTAQHYVLCRYITCFLLMRSCTAWASVHSSTQSHAQWCTHPGDRAPLGIFVQNPCKQ